MQKASRNNGYSPNRGEPLIVSLPGGLSNREDNNGGAPRAKHMCIHTYVHEQPL